MAITQSKDVEYMALSKRQSRKVEKADILPGQSINLAALFNVHTCGAFTCKT